MDKLVCVDDFEKLAHATLNRNALDYYKSGADDEITLRNNRKAFKRWIIRPRMLRNVSNIELNTFVLGKRTELPFGISPTAMQKMAHDDGELGNARAAEANGTIFILSTIATSSLEEVAAAAPNARKWFQLYVYKDRNLSEELVRRAERAGFEALVLTVDAPYFGRRRLNMRNRFTLPKHLRLANFESGDGASGLSSASEGSSALAHLDVLMDQSLTWDDVEWLRSITQLPIIVKGILTKEDAKIALSYKVNGVFVSNHGGRQLDTVNPTIDVLEEIVSEVRGKCEVYLDGGVMTGSDIFKAIALGANMVFLGRPFLWGLAVGGEEGSKKIIDILRSELKLTMALAGVSKISEINRSYLQRYSAL